MRRDPATEPALPLNCYSALPVRILPQLMLYDENQTLTTTVDPSEREDARRSPVPTPTARKASRSGAGRSNLPCPAPCLSNRADHLQTTGPGPWIEALVSVVKIVGPTCRHLNSSERRDSGDSGQLSLIHI